MRQKLSLLTKTMLLLGALMAGSGAWAQETLWSEDFKSYSGGDTPSGGTYSYTCVNGKGTNPGSTTVQNEKLAGGKEAPELMVGKKGSGDGAAGGTFTAVIPLNNIEGTLTLTYYQNKQSLKVSSTTTGVSGGQTLKPSAAGQQTTTFTGITSDMTSITIVFEATTTNNVRLDDIVLTGNKASSIEAPKINLESGFYATAQSVTITTNEDGGTTYYTTDGTAPSNESTPYTGAISITSTTTLKAITYKGEEKSGVVQETYTIAEDGVFDFVAAGAAGYDYGSGMSFSEDYTTTNKTWISGNVTMVSSGKYRWWAADKTLRFYSNTPASAATFSVPEGYVITKIATTGGNFITASEGTLSGSTWTGASQSVTLSISNTTVTFKTMTVTYTTATQTKNVTSAGWATYAPEYPVSFGTEEAYIIEVADDTEAVLTEVSSVPAGTPVLLKGAGDHTLTVVASSSTNVSDNCLKVSDGTITKADGVYVLADGTYGVGFYLWTGEGENVLPAGKVYMEPNATTTRAFFALGVSDSQGISGVTVTTGQANYMYDLQGRRVTKAVKGLYIVDGKKFMMKPSRS